MLSFDSKNQHFTINGEPISLSAEELQEMQNIKWWHAIPFSLEVKTEGYSDAVNEIRDYLVSEVDFSDKSVLDIGCWDGFQSFYAEAHGANRVLGVDDLSQRHSGSAGREFAKQKLHSKVEFRDINVYDFSPEKVGTFDIVMMFGVLYHLVHPMLGLEKACGLAKNDFLISTHFVPSDDEFPWCVLYAEDELAGDHSNWSGPNLSWIRKALEIQGFEVMKEHVYNTDLAPGHGQVTMHARRTNNKYTKDSMLNVTRDTTLL